MKLLLTLLLCAATTLVGAEKFDVAVYGGTAGGAMSAVSAARRGLKVVLLEPGSHIGGMVSGGLSYTDFGKKDVIGGYPLEFYMRVGRLYEMNRFGQPRAVITSRTSPKKSFGRCCRKRVWLSASRNVCAPRTACEKTAPTSLPSPWKTGMSMKPVSLSIPVTKAT